MNVERDTLRDIAISVAAVGFFIAATLVVGMRFDSGGLTEQGALAIVGILVVFVVLMSGIGYWLANQH